MDTLFIESVAKCILRIAWEGPSNPPNCILVRGRALWRASFDILSEGQCGLKMRLTPALWTNVRRDWLSQSSLWMCKYSYLETCIYSYLERIFRNVFVQLVVDERFLFVFFEEESVIDKINFYLISPIRRPFRQYPLFGCQKDSNVRLWTICETIPGFHTRTDNQLLQECNEMIAGT